jgi:hypothetical protein
MEVNKLSSKVEQLLKRWHEKEIVLKIELSSKYISVFGRGIVSGVEKQQLLLDCGGCGYRISLSEATLDLKDTEGLAEPPRLTQTELLVNQLQISVPAGLRVFLSETAN